jgi:hypothetical protein
MMFLTKLLTHKGAASGDGYRCTRAGKVILGRGGVSSVTAKLNKVNVVSSALPLPWPNVVVALPLFSSSQQDSSCAVCASALTHRKHQRKPSTPRSDLTTALQRDHVPASTAPLLKTRSPLPVPPSKRDCSRPLLDHLPCHERRHYTLGSMSVIACFRQLQPALHTRRTIKRTI